MNSTERLLAVLRGEVPDRVPISTYELVGWDLDAWHNRESSYARLMEVIREKTDGLHMTGISVPNLWEERGGCTTQHWDEGDEHWTRVTMRTPRRTLTKLASHVDRVKTVWTRKHWCEDLDDLDAMTSRPWEPGEPDFTALQEAWKELDGTRGLPLISVGDALITVAECFEFGAFTVLAMTEPDAIVRHLDRVHGQRLEQLRLMLTGPVENTVWRICGPEYACPPYLPPRLFARFVTPYVTEYARMIREAGAFARLHVHGRTRRVLDEIAKMHVHALDPVEPPPDGDATVAEVKSALGDVCLMGGIELKHLEHAADQFVEELTRRTIAEGKPGGRFVIMPTAAPIDIPLSPKTERNYIRFIETSLEAGVY
jgi:hypothetical protein